MAFREARKSLSTTKPRIIIIDEPKQVPARTQNLFERKSFDHHSLHGVGKFGYWIYPTCNLVKLQEQFA